MGNGAANGANAQSTFPRMAPKPPATDQARRPFQPVPYQDEERNKIQGLLNKVLGPEYVSSRPGGGGVKVSYIEGWRALNLANEVFGFNGWNSELISTQVDYFDTHGNTGRYSMGLLVVVRVTIKDGTYHEDFGYGFIDNAKSKAMAFEKCKKEAFTDGVKRCLRCFGNVLGNCLYDRTIIGKIQKVELPKPELTDDDFHRDPMVRERERVKKLTTRVVIPEQAVPQVQPHIPQPPNSNQAIPQQAQVKNIPPQLATNTNLPNRQIDKPIEKPIEKTTDQDKPDNPNTSPTSREFEDMDDSFLFSDEDESGNRLDDELRQDLAHHLSQEKPNKAPPYTQEPVVNALPLFVSAKGAGLLQQSPHPTANLPHFDTKFVSPSIRRTVDPHKSAPVKRAEAKALQSTESTNNPILHAPRNPNPLNPNASIDDTTNSLGKRIGMPPSQRTSKRTRLEMKDQG